MKNKTTLELTPESLEMLRKEFEYCRCLIWDDKIKYDSYCNGECHECNNPFKINDWIEMNTVKGES